MKKLPCLLALLGLVSVSCSASVVNSQPSNTPTKQPIYKVSWAICAPPDVLAKIQIPLTYTEWLKPSGGCYRSQTEMIVWGGTSLESTYTPQGLLKQASAPIRKRAPYQIILLSHGCYPESDKPIQQASYTTTNWPTVTLNRQFANDRKTIDLVKMTAVKLTEDELVDINLQTGFSGKFVLAQRCRMVNLP